MAIPIPIVAIGGKSEKESMAHNPLIQIGYELTSEETSPLRDLARFERAAEEEIVRRENC